MLLARIVRSSLLLFLASIAASQGLSYDYGVDVSQLVKRGNGKLIVVRGGTNTRDAVPMRQEIGQLQQDNYAWTVWILALSMMQYTSQDDLLSWYSICGIHGVPFVTWDGVQPTPGNANTGYCHHLSVLFPTWHRAYLALFEQILAGYAQSIAALYPDDADGQAYQEAAANLKIPYWDWAVIPPDGESILPSSIGGSPTMNVSGPNGVQEISNPLYCYEFKPLVPGVFIEPPWSEYPETVRAPTPENQYAQSNNSLVATVLDENASTLRQRLYNLFSNYDNYSTFSNEAWIPEGSNSSFDSLESLHDSVHTFSGLQGHMAFVPFSSFDPIFWLHHCMVDRIFAMWQMLNPDSWIEPTAAAMNSYTTSLGQIEDSQTALTPFFSGSNGSFWNSDMLRDPTVFGYTYPEISGLDPADNKGQLIRAINRLYGSSSPAGLALNRTAVKKQGKPRGSGQRRHQVQKSRGQPREQGSDGQKTDEPIERIVIDSHYREWVANVHVKKQALGGPFFIHLVLDDSLPDSATEARAPRLVGTMGVFAAPASYSMRMADHHTAGTIPMTAALVERVQLGALQDLEPRSVTPFLVDKLSVEVTLPDGTPVTTSDVNGIAVSVVSSKVKAPDGEDELPKWGPTTHHLDVI